MSFWEVFWQIVLLVSVVGFAALVVVIAFGGLADIRAMLRSIEDHHDANDGKSDSPRQS